MTARSPSPKPEILFERALAGVWSSLIGREGFVDWVLVLTGPDSLHVLNYNSPGATGARSSPPKWSGDQKERATSNDSR